LPPDSFSFRFCDDQGCAPDEFVTLLLLLCLNRHARLIYRLRPEAELFAADRELARAVARAVALDEVRAAIDDFWNHPANATWLRRTAAFRLSTRRLRRIAHDYLPFTRPRTGAPGRTFPR